MAFSVLISIEGVMAADSPELVLADPIPEGLILFHALRERFNVVLSSYETREESVTRWLALNGIITHNYARLYISALFLDAPEARRRHIMEASSHGYDLRYVVDDSPDIARFCIERGITPLCCPHPSYSRSSFLPDSKRGGKSWEEIEASIAAQRELKAGDGRLSVNDSLEELLEDDR